MEELIKLGKYPVGARKSQQVKVFPSAAEGDVRPRIKSTTVHKAKRPDDGIRNIDRVREVAMLRQAISEESLRHRRRRLGRLSPEAKEISRTNKAQVG